MSDQPVKSRILLVSDQVAQNGISVSDQPVCAFGVLGAAQPRGGEFSKTGTAPPVTTVLQVQISLQNVRGELGPWGRAGPRPKPAEDPARR